MAKGFKAEIGKQKAENKAKSKMQECQREAREEAQLSCGFTKEMEKS